MRRFFKQRFYSILLVGVSLALSPLAVHADTVTSASYSLTRHQISTAANHEFQFTTPTGVDASSDTIIVTYPSGFDLSAIAVSDIDLSHGATTGLETSETLAASAGAGVWGVATSTSAVTFTAPTDAGGSEITGGHIVVIRIGTNASGGSGQIVNPSSAQTAVIGLSGTFGDTAEVSVPILTTDQVTVTATVASTASTSTPGGGGGGGDTQAPVISNVQVINITSSTASVVWDTDEPSDSTVEYGITISYGSSTLFNATDVYQHQIDLSGLTASTTYHFRVSSRDSSGNLAVSTDYTFTTLGDLNPPIISNVQVINITDTTALVIWNTDEPATSLVNFGLTSAYGSSVNAQGLVTNHAVQLVGLTPGTIYHVSVTSVDASNNTASSPDSTFTTLPDTTAPANVLGFTATGGDAVVFLAWTPPPDPDYAGVHIVRKTDSFPTAPFDGTLVYSGGGVSLQDPNVTNGTTYFYGAFAFDTNNNFASGALDDATPQGQVPGLENSEALCSNGVDDDNDQFVDCADTECQAFPICQPPPPPEPPEPPETPETPEPPAPGGEPTLPTPTPGGELINLEPAYYGSQGTVQLLPNTSQQYGSPSGFPLLVVLPISNLDAGISQVQMVLGGDTYNLSLSPDGTSYQATVVTPTPGLYNVAISAEFQNGDVAVSYATIVSHGLGRVVEEGVLQQTDVGVSGAVVTLYNADGSIWDATPFAQANPVVTSQDGTYAFVVPNGSYYAVASKGGYLSSKTPIVFVGNNVFNRVIGMVPIPQLPEPTVTSTIPLPFVTTANQALQDALFGLTALRTLIQSEGVQKAVENVASPAVLAFALLNVLAALPAFNLLSYLQFLFTEPILALFRKKRQKWGVVYNSLSKRPVDLAIVRLLHASTRLPYRTSVTDASGRYSFNAESGRYYIEVRKPGFLFPSQFLMGKNEDVEFTDLYHGKEIVVGDSDVLTHNIPVDPVIPSETPRKILLKRSLRSLQSIVALTAIVFSLIALISAPGLKTALFLTAHIVLFFIFRKLGAPKKPKSWGKVIDSSTGQPVKNVVLRVFETKYNKLLETKVTDGGGKYGFFVRENVYYITAEKEGYESYTSPPIDLRGREEGFIDADIRLSSKK